MNVETLTALILDKMLDIGKWQKNFMIHLMPLLLTIRGRHNFENLSRYGSFNEATYRVRYEGEFAFEKFNEELILSLPEEERIIAFDPSYLPKSGKHTPGTSYFWSGCANATKYGLEMSGFASVGLESRTAMHLYAKQTIGQDCYDRPATRSLLDYYASLVVDQTERLKAIADTLVADGYFWRKPFVEAVTDQGFTLISKLPSNAVLHYPFLGPKPKRRGRPPKYAGRVDRLTLNPAHFTPCLSENNLVAYEGKVYVKALNRLVKCVIVHTTKKDGSLRAEAFFCTDPTMNGAKVLECYRLRFQIEFLYRPAARRDAKQHTGLTECQARSEQKIHTHLNASLTVVSLAKAVYAWPQTGQDRKPFSLSSIKTQYFNEHLLRRFFTEFGIPPETYQNSPQYRVLHNYGCIDA